MKLCFSTVGCPNWSWGEITAAAKDLGYQGIELRGLGEDLYMPSIGIFAPAVIDETAQKLSRLGLEVPCIATDVVLCGPQDPVESVKAYLRMADSLKAPYLRLLGDEWGMPGENVDIGLVTERLKTLAPLAQACGVTLLVETNGVLADTRVLRGVIEAVNSPAVAVLWDIQHTVRNYGETVADTWNNVGDYVRHVHIKDSVSENGQAKYKMVSHGDLPLSALVGLLKSGGYDGYLSLEWIRRWNPELEDAGVVFAQYIYEMKKMLG